VRGQRAQQLPTIDPHAPPRARSNVATMNRDGFLEAGGKEPGQEIHRKRTMNHILSDHAHAA